MELWATRGRKKVTHFITKASWEVGLNEWATAHGWHFAQKAVKVALSKTCPASAHRCKCEAVKEVRDNVQGGAGLAQLVSEEKAAKQSNTGGSDRSDLGPGRKPNLQYKKECS